MKKESTYNKYKRERSQLKALVSMDIQNFMLIQDVKEFAKRSAYLRECMIKYRAIAGDNLK